MGGTIQIRQCSVCQAYLQHHPALYVPRVTEQRLTARQTWRHTTPSGRHLHRLAMRSVKEEQDAQETQTPSSRAR